MRSPFLGSPGAWSSLESSALFLLLPVSSLVPTGCMIHGFITFGCFVWFPLQLSRSSWRTGFLHTLQCWNVANTCHRSGVWSDYKNIFHQQEHTSTRPNYPLVLLCPIACIRHPSSLCWFMPVEVCPCIRLRLGSGPTLSEEIPAQPSCGNNERVRDPSL